MTTTETKTKEPPAMADVRTRGSVTTVKLTAAGKATITRVDALFEELLDNSAVPIALREGAKEANAAWNKFVRTVQEYHKF